MAKERVPVLSQFEWQKSVLDKDLSTPPGSPTAGDRYIVGSSPTGGWVGQTNTIATWDGTAWIFDSPTDGWFTYIADETILYWYKTGSWSPYSANPAHNIDFHTDVPTKPVTGTTHLENDAGTLSWVPVSTGAGKGLINYCFAGTKPYAKVRSSSWYISGAFIFEGTATIGVPTSVEIIAYVKDTGTTGNFRIYDYTNTNEICNITVTGKNKAIHIDSSLINLPTGESILEIQGKSNNGKEVYIEALMVKF